MLAPSFKEIGDAAKLAPTPPIRLPAAQSSRDASRMRLLPISAFPEGGSNRTFDEPELEAARRVADWIRGYLMQPHPRVGRAGVVCPFTPITARMDVIRIGLSPAREEEAILRNMTEAMRAFEAIDCPKGQRHFRAALVGFPNCADDEGRARLKRVQNRLRGESILRGKMIGLFEPNAQDKGVVNPDFRPMRSPLPLLAIRMLVENDAPFVVRNPLLAPIYLLKFPLTGTRKLMSLLWS
jgi:hypothetical protein